jgi:hypothetical protein
MASSFSSESANCRLDELHKKETKAEAEKEQLQNLLKISALTEERWKIVDALKSLNDVIALIMQERMQIVDKMKRQMEIGITRSPSKKMRRSLPPPTSGFKWTSEILESYGISFKDVYSVDELVFQTAPATSGRAKRFTDACSIISYENILKAEFPSDHQAALLAKHLYRTTSSCFGNMEVSIDDMVMVLFDALGFNDEDLITVSRNKLNFQMSNKIVCADADLTVFNLKSLIRLAVVEDKRIDKTLGMDSSGEPQLIAEAVAAVMYNKKILDTTKSRRAISEPRDSDSKTRTTTTMNSLYMSDLMFMIRVSGWNVFFYSHKFSDDLLNGISMGIEPLNHSQIQKFTPSTKNKQRHDLSLLIPADRVIIFQILDCIQQIISKM